MSKKGKLVIEPVKVSVVKPDGCWNCQCYRNGKCHFGPPQTHSGNVNENGLIGSFPSMKENDWCFQHKAK